jgi:hypothetical protein
MVLALALLLFQAPAVPKDPQQKATKATSPDPIVLAHFENLPIHSDASFQPGHTELTPALPQPAPAPDPEPAALDALPLSSEAAAAEPLIEPVLSAPRKQPKKYIKTWWALGAADHAAATFDAYTTRRFIQNGTGQELNPFYRPFAGSSLLYVAVQVAPTALDYVAKRMMASERPWIHRVWWVPQSIGTAASFASGVHNLTIH